MRRAAPLLLALAVVAVVVLGLSQAGGKARTQTGPRFDAPAELKRLKGAPAPLAALHAQANQLLGGGVPAFRARLKDLRGHPVVINKWGSWCGPCRSEFPIFQRAGARHGKTVAFLGLDGRDNRGEAQSFLADFPLTYPSYVDYDEKIARDIGAPNNYPITVYVDERGRTAYIHQGPYRTDADIDRDIDRYLG